MSGYDLNFTPHVALPLPPSNLPFLLPWAVSFHGAFGIINLSPIAPIPLPVVQLNFFSLNIWIQLTDQNVNLHYRESKTMRKKQFFPFFPAKPGKRTEKLRGNTCFPFCSPAKSILIKQNPNSQLQMRRDDWIRTSGPYVPNVVRYRAALHPEMPRK